MKASILFMALASSCLGGEFAVLSTGYQLHVERHELEGGQVRLYRKDGGFTEMDAALISRYEKEIEPTAPPSPPVPAVQPASAPLSPRELVEAAANRNGLPPQFVHSVVAAESGYRTDAVSPKGAIGLMQLMPATAQAFNADPHNPSENVEAGAAYLRDLLIKYGGDARRALAAYNAGPGAVDRYNGVPPYAETRTYVERVLRNYQRTSAASGDGQ